MVSLITQSLSMDPKDSVIMRLTCMNIGSRKENLSVLRFAFILFAAVYLEQVHQ